MDIYLKKATLHVVDREAGEPIYSTKELDLSKEFIRDYIEKKIKKSSTAQTLVGTLRKDSKVGEIIQSETSAFIEKSRFFVEYWFQQYRESESGPSCDVFFVQFEMDTRNYFAFLKVDFMQSLTHLIDSDEHGFYNDLLVHRAMLSPMSKKADESFVIESESLNYELIEKKYEISGEKKFYFSTKVIESVPNLSFDQNIKVIQKTAEKIGSKFDEPVVQLKADLQDALAHSFKSEEKLVIDQIAQSVFKGNITAQLAFKEEVQEQGVSDQAPMVSDIKSLTDRKFGKQKIKLSNGIELIVPMDVYRDPELIEFIQQPDGTLSVVIKDFVNMIEE